MLCMDLTDWLVEFIADSVKSANTREGVQPRLNRIAQRKSFQSIFKELCTELMVPEHQAEESRKKIYEWFCTYVHTGGGYNDLVVNTDGTGDPTSVAIALLAYFRESTIKHSYVIRGETLEWPALY